MHAGRAAWILLKVWMPMRKRRFIQSVVRRFGAMKSPTVAVADAGDGDRSGCPLNRMQIFYAGSVRSRRRHMELKR
jgi:hypothetical protein